MNVTEVLQLADELVYQQTGKHLDDSQEVVLKGVWEGKTYEEIADSYNRSERHARDVGYKLWQILSEQLGEDIHKSNFHSTFERLKSSHHSNTQQVVNIGINSNINLYPNGSKLEHSISVKTDDTLTVKSVYHDLTLAPQIIKFYNRETELETLSNWILNQNTPLISVLGLSGIGKSYLVRKFIDLNLEQYEVIIWKRLKFPKFLDLFINDLLQVCKQEVKESLDDKFKQLFDIFYQKRCLIIIDDIQNILISGQFAGQYKPEHKDYQKFFTMITETEHQSKVILISQEKCAEIHCLDKQLYSIKSLELSGLNDINILENTGLNNQDSWLKLIQFYEGNPTYLKNIVSLIQDVYDGEVADFLEENSLIITQTMESHFNDLFNRLSSIEQQIILELSKSDQLISREDLKQKLPLSSVDFVKGLQSLQQRYLVTKIKEEKVMFKLSPVFGEYVKSCCKD